MFAVTATTIPRAHSFNMIDEFRVKGTGSYVDGNPPANAVGCSPSWFQEHPSFRNGGLVVSSFFEHGGINFTAIVRAFFANMRAGRAVQGGSTITQQVAKNFLLSSDQTYKRKIKEMILDALEDVIVTIGGASVGDHDLVRPALLEVGASLDFWKVAICAAAARSSSVAVGMGPPSAGTSRFVWMPIKPSGALRPIASVTPAPTSPP